MKFIFFHIGKCGGATIRDLFTNINSLKHKVFNQENSFENYCSKLIQNKNLINDIEYIEVHAGSSVSFYNSINLIKNLKTLYENKIFIFTSFRDPLKTIISLQHYLYKHKKINNNDYEYFKNNYNYNYISNYLYNGCTAFGRFNILPNNGFDKKNIKNINDFYLDDKKFKNLINYLDYYMDYILYLDDIENFIKFINKNYNVKLKYEHKIINKNNYDQFTISEDEKKDIINNLEMDYKIYNRYRNKKNFKMYLGSCRINGGSSIGWRSKYFNINESSELGEKIAYPYSTKEIIQLLKFINNEINIPENILHKCFRSFTINTQSIDKYIKDKNYLLNIFNNIDIFILEICSRKIFIAQEKYYYCDNYIRRLEQNKNLEELNNIEHKIMNEEDILQDIKFIQKYLKKPILIVSHINCKLNNSIIETRNNLINSLENICDKNNIAFYNPTLILDYFDQENVMNKDLVHYNYYYFDIITRVINYNILNI